MFFFLRIMHPKDAEGIANSVDPDQTEQSIWVCTVCPDLSVRKLRNITVIQAYPFCGWTARLCGFESLVLTIVLKTGSTEFLGDIIIQLYRESDQ